MSRLPHLGWSSNVYPLEVADLLAQTDYADVPIPDAALPADPVVLFIRPDGPDALLRGRETLESVRAERGERATVDVRVVFRPSIAKWNLPCTLIRVIRNFFRFQGAGVYHIDAHAVRAMGVERAVRTLDNVAHGHEHKMKKLYTTLRESGYNDAKPIKVMLCRIGGVRDSLRNGHHRVSACLELGVNRMAIQFSAAGALPRELCRVWQ